MAYIWLWCRTQERNFVLETLQSLPQRAVLPFEVGDRGVRLLCDGTHSAVQAYIVMAYIVMAYIVMASDSFATARTVRSKPI